MAMFRTVAPTRESHRLAGLPLDEPPQPVVLGPWHKLVFLCGHGDNRLHSRPHPLEEPGFFLRLPFSAARQSAGPATNALSRLDHLVPPAPR